MIKPHLHFLLAVPAGWLMKSLEICLLSFCLVIGMYDPVTGRDFDISTYIESDSLTVGDKFLLINTLDGAYDYKVEPAPVDGQLGDAAVLSDLYRLELSDPGKIAYACTLSVYKPGEIEIAPLVFNITDSLGNTKQVPGEKLKLTVYSVLPEDTAGIEIADIKEPMRLRGPIWPYLLIPLVILLVLLSVYLLRKYLKGKAAVPEIPPRPPWEIAYEKLDRLRNERHTEFGRLKGFYFELSLIIREYLEGRYFFPAAEYTTCELENTDQLRELENGLYSRLFALFNRADLAKFAKFRPSVENADSDLKFAYEFVSKTVPAAVNGSAKEKELEKALT